MRKKKFPVKQLYAFPKRLADDLELAAERLGKTKSEIVRLALKKWLAAHAQV